MSLSRTARKDGLAVATVGRQFVSFEFLAFYNDCDITETFVFSQGIETINNAPVISEIPGPPFGP